MIRERIVSFLARLSDNVFAGRNRARIVLGTDRKNTIDSGYGDGGENDPESAAIDLVAGFEGDNGNPNYQNDKSRLYLSGKTNPDEYFGINKGSAVEGEASAVLISDNVYLKAREKTKIIGPDYSITMEDGKMVIEFNNQIDIKVSGNTVRLTQTGIELDAGQGTSGKIITDNDSCVGIDPVSGSPIISNFKQIPLGAVVTNNKVVVK